MHVISSSATLLVLRHLFAVLIYNKHSFPLMFKRVFMYNINVFFAVQTCIKVTEFSRANSTRSWVPLVNVEFVA